MRLETEWRAELQAHGDQVQWIVLRAENGTGLQRRSSSVTVAALGGEAQQSRRKWKAPKSKEEEGGWQKGNTSSWAELVAASPGENGTSALGRVGEA